MNSPILNQQSRLPAQIPKLTLNNIDAQKEFQNLSPEKKAQLIEFVYNLSLVLYHSYLKDNEKS